MLNYEEKNAYVYARKGIMGTLCLRKGLGKVRREAECRGTEGLGQRVWIGVGFNGEGTG